MRPSTITLGFAALLGLSAGCASERATSEPPSYQDLKQDELASERREFIEAKKQRLSEVSREIDLLETRLTHESKFVDESQQASWKQDLFEHKQERERIRAELDRAETASPEEWKEMRGTLGTATDSLEAGVKKLRAEVSEALALGDDEGSKATIAADSGLCPVGVPGAQAEVEQQGERVAVSVTTDDTPSVAKLREKGNDLAKTTQAYQPARSESKGAAETKTGDSTASKAEASDADQGDSHAQHKAGPIAVAVTASNIEDGIKLVFTPKNGQANSLRAQLEQDAEQLESGRCQAATAVSMRTESR